MAGVKAMNEADKFVLRFIAGQVIFNLLLLSCVLTKILAS